VFLALNFGLKYEIQVARIGGSNAMWPPTKLLGVHGPWPPYHVPHGLGNITKFQIVVRCIC